ncbi:type I-E CRISPR-associated protein Cas6/Cse3/CasE [Trueperella bialowiezensis]|uniref:CRISPR-associated protein Cas6/Cse3/CasE, subtype I-E/ECOLI n=1 Tax=Trueperella bialowiezensis TaxID=312285 RepID=A0A3S4VAV4_9ACTO|nr:type I-E CRISPR-associated protein Cas6/Cse3/CasE [Trueperella bialowiezensis]VEI13469.1 CRISPR-associated protein Cas6/Cse3/CasE, subtype I-E/ECOLI [Trueperella bialowiezensis]
MTTFTRLQLNPARRQARKYLTNPQALHAAVMASFPRDVDQNNERILWRLDQRGEQHLLYVVGPEKPRAAHIVEEAGWEIRPQETADYDRLLERLAEGQVWNFELLANPTKSINRGRERRGKVVAHLSVPEQIKWLLGKAESIGVDVGSLEHPTFNVTESKTLNFSKAIGTEGKRRRVHLVTARYAGRLKVTDAEKLRSALVNGVGRAKGYGCGLITLARGQE